LNGTSLNLWHDVEGHGRPAPGSRSTPASAFKRGGVLGGDSKLSCHTLWSQAQRPGQKKLELEHWRHTDNVKLRLLLREPGRASGCPGHGEKRSEQRQGTGKHKMNICPCSHGSSEPDATRAAWAAERRAGTVAGFNFIQVHASRMLSATP
jgi:hypothetical protein